MSLWTLCQIVLLCGSCWSQNLTDDSETQGSVSQSMLTNKNTTAQTTIADNSTGKISSTATTMKEELGIDDGDNGKADNLADYFKKKVEELMGGGTDVDEDTETVVGAPAEEDLYNCSLPAVLGYYCQDIPNDVKEYFQYDTSLTGILAFLFKPDMVKALQLACKPGNWCLSDSFHQDVIQSKSRFYTESPFCSDGMGSCLKKMQEKRSSCGEELLGYLKNSVDLLCELEKLGYEGKECYARTVEALYVTYADLTNPYGSQREYLQKTDCNDFKVQMTKMYLCADDVCNFDQNVLLEKFEKWVGIAQTAAEVAKTCNISRVCQSDYEAYDEYSIPFSYYDNYDSDYDYETDENYDDTTPYYDVTKVQGDVVTENTDTEDVEDSLKEEEIDQYEGDRIEDNNEMNTISEDGYDENDRSMLLGLIVMTTALLLGFLCLACIVYRRFKRAQNGNYRWDYSQLTNEDARVVHK